MELARSELLERPSEVSPSVRTRESALLRLRQGVIDGRQAAAELGISTRQLRRLRAAYVQHGTRGLIHGNVGRRPRNAIDPVVAGLVRMVALGAGQGLSQQALTRLINEAYGVKISRPSVHRILRRAGLASRRAAASVALPWRGLSGGDLAGHEPRDER